jgi:capsular exopolysaccharide synthesis family protein
MGKVYDALRKAEEQRASRFHDAAGAGHATSEPMALPRGGADAAFPGLRDHAAPGGESADAQNKRRIVMLQPESTIAEQFRSLRARIDALAATRPRRTSAVTSSLPDEGKTMAAISLAAVSSMQLAGRVVLVECDLRQPTIAAALGLRLEAGIGELLVDGTPLERALQRAPGTALDVLAVRGLPPNPSELLSSEAFRRLIEELATRYDRVVLDLPPTLGLPDAKTVSGMCDGTVLVVRADSTAQADVEAALEVLGRERLLGVVMNGAELPADRYAKYLRD